MLFRVVEKAQRVKGFRAPDGHNHNEVPLRACTYIGGQVNDITGPAHL